MTAIHFRPASLPESGALALLVPQDTPLFGLAAAADAACGGALTRAMQAAEFTGRKGQTCTVLAHGAFTRTVLVGLGKPEQHTLRTMEEAGGAAAAALTREPHAAVATDGMPPSHATHAALGAVLRSYRFDRYRTEHGTKPASGGKGADAKEDDAKNDDAKNAGKPRLATVDILCDDPAAAGVDWPAVEAIAHGTALARDLVSEPPNVLNPAEMAERCRVLEGLGVEVEVLGPAELQAAGFGALMGVSQGSVNEPRLVVMQWRGAPDKAGEQPACFVGKGVTFDSGGISLKPGAGMGDMKFDMAGAGAVIGLMATLAGRKARANVVGLVGLTENMPSGNAQRPGDVVRSLSGQTIEVLNTDAEGRLVLADVLWYAQDRFNPAFSVDLATLTGAIIVSLGHEYAGLFSNDDTLATRLLAAGTATGEQLWRMPMGDSYDKLIRSDIADMKNIGGRPGGAIIGAQFIARFVRGPWAHLDIAGTAWSTRDTATVPKGATAFGLRLLDQVVRDHLEA